MGVFWDVAPSRLVEVYRRSRGPWCLYPKDDGGLSDLGTKDL
jgi:hypothetical protein